MSKNNFEFFHSVFGNEVTNVEFFGTKEKGFNCVIYSEDREPVFSNSDNFFESIYDAFKFAYERYLTTKS